MFVNTQEMKYSLQQKCFKHVLQLPIHLVFHIILD